MRVKSVNGFLEKWIYLTLPLLMIIGFGAGKYLSHFSILTPYLFMLLTMISSFSADWRKFGDVIKKPMVFLGLLVLIHVAIPWFALYSAGVFPSMNPQLVTGIVLTAMLPIGVTSIFWVGFAKGNVTMSLSFVTLNTLLSPILVPASLFLLMGSKVELDALGLILGLLKLVLIPSLLGMMIGDWLRKRNPLPWFKPTASLVSKLSLYGVVLFNAATLSDQLLLIGSQVVELVVMVLALMFLGYLISYGLARFVTTEQSQRIAITFSGGVRNYTVGVVLATSFFPSAVALPVLVAMLMQHPMAMLFHFILKKEDQKQMGDLSKAG